MTKNRSEKFLQAKKKADNANRIFQEHLKAHGLGQITQKEMERASNDFQEAMNAYDLAVIEEYQGDLK